MDGLTGIGKNRSNAVIRNAAARRTGLVEEVSGDAEGGGDQGEDNGETVPKNDVTATPYVGPLCAVCRKRQSPYTCPQCNIPYCSLTCFRAKKHEACAGSFARQALKSDAQQQQQQQQQELAAAAETVRSSHKGTSRAPNGGARVDEVEREAMMDVLHKMQQLGTDKVEAGESDAEESDVETEIVDGEDEDIRAHARRLGVDLDGSDTEGLLALLSPTERARFEALIREHTPDVGPGARPKPELERLLKKLGETMRWWRGTKLDDYALQPKVTKRFAGGVDAVRQTMTKNQSTTEKLEWNIVTLILAYVYVVQHLDLVALDQIDSADEKAAALQLFIQLTPFTVGQAAMAQTCLSSAEEATLWIVSRLGQDVGKEPARTLRSLYEETLAILQPDKVILTVDPADSNDLRALHDVHTLLPDKAAKRKIIFYAAYWQHLVSSKTQYDATMGEIKGEIARLDAEIKRTEDEERWHAAHDAVREQKHGGLVLPD